MSTAYIGIGSNLGDRLENCLCAIKLLNDCNGIEVVKVSEWYESKAEAVDGSSFVDEPPYINGAAKLRTSLSPEQLLSALIKTEADLGRFPCRKKGAPRSIDLDLLLYEDKIIDTPHLTVPHPALQKRLFVLAPLCDIAPEAVADKNGRTVLELFEHCRKNCLGSIIRKHN